MSLLQNERIKLSAALSNTGVATIVTAFIAPITAYLYGSSSISGGGWWLISVAWLFVGVGLHVLAQIVPRETSRMSDLQIYLLVAPLVLLAVAAVGTFVFLRIIDRGHIAPKRA